MKHIVVDLEMNTIRPKNEVRRICTNETIEIGAVMLDENLHEITSFKTYVKPEYNDSIAPKIRKITGITDEMVQDAPTFQEAFRMFSEWCAGSGEEFTIYTWSDSDYKQISKEMILKEYAMNEVESTMMSNPWSDFQKEFDTHIGFERQLSLKFALEMAGIDFEGKEHDALDDARNTAELLHVFKDEDLFNATLRKIEECMKPTPCSVTLGSLFDFSAFVTA